ncbi:phosphotransferase [Synechococcus sp. HB1133]|uniref:phosphotransferase family protein n=2 Tax=Synechococcus TaxID=1129 RepID=UPI001408D50A|nr:MULTISPECIES: phosphotransferase [unclassified Synechococcus]MCB4394399.1 phosphotransferase [Synechococcus sp. PH41509]MCB4423360.1 phosphotransferase [Synechococcus sp. HB1133]MCB4430846.1 phosphotransferase [Synechococcus sp. HBA1120]NHI82308.1 aminoglycoside phosphotransferase family protein [Synechococcus sp. HB1133]
MVSSSERRTMPAPETEFRSDQQIAADFLSYLQSEFEDPVVYEVEPTRLTGGFDARLYRYQLVDQEPRVLRIERPERKEEGLLYHQFVYQTLNQQGLKTPVIHHVCGDKSILAGVFAVMDLLPGRTVFELAPELHAKVLGESMATMHEMDVRPIIEAFRQSDVPDELYLSPISHQKALDSLEEAHPWASELIGWLRTHLPLDGRDLAVIHGDYHGNNVMFDNGSVSGVLDWWFSISDPAVDLAHTMNDYLVFARQIDPTMSPHLWHQIMDGALKAYQSIRPLNHEHIKAFRVFHLFGVFTAGGTGVGLEFMRKPESQRDYLSFIEQTTGLTLSPSA